MLQTCTVAYIDHVGVVVRNLESAFVFFEDVFGLKPGDVKELPDQGVRATLLEVGQTRLELLEPLGLETPVGRFLERQGEGLHHLALNVSDVSQSLAAVKASGLQVIDQTPREGLSGIIAFIHPRSAHGILTELVQTV